ncbi:hypothetical protein A0H81_07462, partial [Grifola frondosa]
MPRRTLTPATPVPTAPLTAPPRDISVLAQSDPQWASNLLLLRRQWKWASFSQFFYTFAPLLSMPDVSLTDVEDDLARSTAIFLPRIMHRLLYTLTQDRKITIDNWQTSLRKQYVRRDPDANPIGPEPKLPSRDSSWEPSTPVERDNDVDASATPAAELMNATGPSQDANAATDDLQESVERLGQEETLFEPKSEPKEDPASMKKEDTVERVAKDELEESKDWLELPMLAKLDSLHLLTEWQFQHPQRLRSIMKNDDEGANWRIEPVGYDAKTCAYWLIGREFSFYFNSYLSDLISYSADRLWIQRVPPKPPKSKNLKRKRTAAAGGSKASARASSSKIAPVPESDEESDVPTPSKRKRVQANGRSTRTRSQVASAPAEPTTGKSTRAAKVQANKKLDAQAKELAEFQRQAAALANAKAKATSNSTPRASKQAQASPSRRGVVGTRASARLKGSGGRPSSEQEDEWQQVPEEWLKETIEPELKSRDVSKGKGKGKDSDNEAEELDAEQMMLRKAGLEGDSSSELTELSEDEDKHMDVDKGSSEAPQPPARTNGTKTGSRKSVRSTRSAAVATTIETNTIPNRSKTEQESPEDTLDDAPLIPKDFIEWEAICVTLYEWEHIAERFEKATHYLEKALYKVLSQSIVPAVTAELKEAERRRRLEEAIVHRKRSSRIAIKESEKEEARAAAKKKAEEDEKTARARRQEARMKKEEAERERREQAREQRRIEREEREARAQAKADRADQSIDAGVTNLYPSSTDVEFGGPESTATPVANGTHSTGSVQSSRVVTPSGVRTPDWILDCEICLKHGVNIDDGLPMVCCGMCGKWQHITCHDLADQRAGRPRRNWDVQQFYCLHCRPRASNGRTYTAPQQQPYAATQQYSWQQGSSAVHPQKAAPSVAPDPYIQSTSDVRFFPRQPVENGMGYSQQQRYPPTTASSPSPSAYSRAQHSVPLTFAHYQPEQRGFQRASQTSPVQAPPVWSNGYPSADSMNARSQPVQFVSQYPQGNTVYANGRMPSAYQSQSVPQLQAYGTSYDSTQLRPNSRWPASNGYHSQAPAGSAVQVAAESLATMHEGGGNRYAAAGWSQSQSPYAQQQRQPQSQHPYMQNQPNGDALTNHGYGAMRGGQHLPAGSTPAYRFPS